MKQTVIENLIERGMCNNINRAYISEKYRCATFLLYGVRGYLEDNNTPLGYQLYRPDVSTKKLKGTSPEALQRYYTHHRKVKELNDVPVYGLETLDVDKGHLLFITEGVFESGNISRLGYNSIALLGSDPPKMLKGLLQQLPYNLVWCGDNDSAGRNSKMSNICEYTMFTDKDIDELDDKVLEGYIEGVYNQTWLDMCK